MRFIFLVLVLILSFKAISQRVLNDFSFTLHEETVNKVLAAIGEISGTNDYEVMFFKGKYHWKVINPQIKIRPDSSQFICDAVVNVGPFNYKTKVDGDVKISYDKQKDKIVIKISRAIFELYTVIFDKKVHIKDIHLEEYFKEPFLFDGPKSYGTSMEVNLPDTAKKKIYIQPTECDFIVKWQEVTAACEVIVTDKPFKLEQLREPSKAIPAQTVSALPSKSASVAPNSSSVAPSAPKSGTASAQKK